MQITIPKHLHKAFCTHAAKPNGNLVPLNGICVEIENGRVILAVSDTHRIVCFSPLLRIPEEIAEVKALPNSRVVLTVAAFKGRSSKYAGDFKVNLDAIRADEQIEGLFPRYRECIPASCDRVGVSFGGNTGEAIIELNDGIDLNYALAALPVLEHIGTQTLTQTEQNAAYLAERGARPWSAPAGTVEEYAAIVIMPVRCRKEQS